jgi:serine protease
MSFGNRARRWSARGATALVPLASAGVLLASAGTQAAATTAQASMVPAAAAVSPPVINPYAPAYHHPYRHGAVPTRGAAAQMAAWARQHPGAAAASRAAAAPSPNNLSYGGGVGGIGVTTGRAKVYLVFIGSQWGRKGRNSHGYVTLSGDHAGEAPYLQRMFKGLGTNGERWSGVMTQYCQGIAAGRQSCPATAPHVRFPPGGVLAGVWVDKRVKSPTQATGHRLGREAVDAAAHFGNRTAASNRNAQYVILSPPGTDPDQYQEQQFCAWHDWNGDSTLSGGPVTSSHGHIAFTNMPYVTDVGATCGAHFVRSGGGGKLDGVSIVAGHEYAETLTDQNPPGGWIDSSGEENADKCAWRAPGSTGGAAVLHLSTGPFAMQGTWANDANSGAGGCRFTHSIVSTQ